MKFSCNTKDIASAVGAASKVVNAHTTVPILSNVLLQAEDGKIAVRATDLELTLEHAFPAEITESGSVTVPAKLFSSYLGNLPAGMLELTGTPTRASVKYDRSNYDFHALPPDEYPPLPAATRGSHFTIAAKKFREGIDSTIFAASGEEARGAVLMGTLLELEGNALTMVATDGYRLAKFTTTLDDGITGSERYIVPSRALAEASRNLGGGEQIAVSALGAQSNQLQMTAGATSITVRLVDGQYPNYQQVIPAKFDRSLTLNTAGADRRAAPRRTRRRRSREHGKTRGQQSNADRHGEFRRLGQRLRRTRSRTDRRRFDDRVQRALSRRDPQPHQERQDRDRVPRPAFARRDPSARADRRRQPALRVDAAAAVVDVSSLSALAPPERSEAWSWDRRQRLRRSLDGVRLRSLRSG